MPSKLFEPIKVGNIALQHRVVLAPLTRYKADDAHVPYLPLVAEYYGQRASRPGSLLIAEATTIAARAGGYAHVPGIWSPEQIAAWKSVTQAVHAKSSFIFMQLRAYGRAANYAQLQSEDPSLPYVSASDEYVGLYAQAAKNAIEAGFDGVEIHGANGYLVDQFLQDVSNMRTDEYGGSVENRARFALEVVDAVAAAIGTERTAIRFSPWSPFLGRWACPIRSPTFSYVISELAARYPGFAYLHLIEPRVSGNSSREAAAHESNDALRALWAPRPCVRAGGFTRKSALGAAESGDLVAFGRLYISNPDLPARLEKDVPLTAYDRSTFYLVGENSPRGYTDQEFATVTA
ncbi:FMN-linked oxidoreductase [Mycena venus]|uniref:FMN-linked oxidoreductase n=1 Tax=Mycena venus TaxID=2733690 RepID=A0A8H6XL86_9AGAR|nr:FMN-linked oxidoreductase [Mycena venus]